MNKKLKKIRRAADIARHGLAVVALIVAVFYAYGFNSISPTLAYFSDTETSPANSFTAHGLYFTLGFGSPMPAMPMGFSLMAMSGEEPGESEEPEEPAGQTIIINNEGSLGFQYKTEVADIACDAALADDITLTVVRDGVEVYSGAPAGFSIITADSSGTWGFTSSLNGSSGEDDAVCSFDVVFTAWRTDTEFAESGFWDEETLTIDVMSSGTEGEILGEKLLIEEEPLVIEEEGLVVEEGGLIPVEEGGDTGAEDPPLYEEPKEDLPYEEPKDELGGEVFDDPPVCTEPPAEPDEIAPLDGGEEISVSDTGEDSTGKEEPLPADEPVKEEETDA